MIGRQMDAVDRSCEWDVSAQAVDCAGLGVWEILPATGTWICSPRARELLGVAENDAPANALSKEDRKRFGEAIARAMRGGEYRLELRAGNRWLLAIGRVGARAPRALKTIVGTLQDVTGHKLEVEERELRLGEVAHDLLSPLTAIRFGVHVARQKGKESQEALLRIDAATQAMERIISELLDFSRSRLAAPEQAPMALADVCRSVIADAAIVYPDREIVLDVHDDPVGEWDRVPLRQVVRNLIENALEHGQSDAPVEVSLTDSGKHAILTVVNSGSPIPDELRAHLFEPFRRRSSKSKGVGLGLFMVKRIVEAHGGSVEMSSDETRTVFQVALPKG
jgi:signal transduction histidine kinase